MIICDLCGEGKDCLQKEIEGREYDICSGRAINREIVLLPPPRAIKEREDEEPGSLPGDPPKIFGAMNTPATP